MTLVRLEPATPRSRFKHSTIEPCAASVKVGRKYINIADTFIS